MIKIKDTEMRYSGLSGQSHELLKVEEEGRRVDQEHETEEEVGEIEERLYSTIAGWLEMVAWNQEMQEPLEARNDLLLIVRRETEILSPTTTKN